MRIAIDCREFYKGKITGIGRFLSGFISYASRVEREREFLLLGSQDTVFPDIPQENVRKKVIHEFNAQLWDQVLLPTALREEKCSLFFSPYNKTCLFSAVPSVIAIHDLTGLLYPGYGKNVWLQKRLARRYARKASAIVTLSENSRRDIIRLLSVPSEKITVMGAAVDGGVFRPVEVDPGLLARLGVKKPYVLYVGNSNPHKNVEGLVRTWSLMDEATRGGYSLVLAGVGRYIPPSDSGNIVAIGHAGDDLLPRLYSGAELFVFPSFYEGFGLPPVEAMACGCPVASSSASCMPEILGDACLYFDPSRPDEMAAVISSALGDPLLRAGLRAKGLERAKRYSPDKVYAAGAELFEGLLRAGGS